MPTRFYLKTLFGVLFVRCSPLTPANRTAVRLVTSCCSAAAVAAMAETSDDGENRDRERTDDEWNGLDYGNLTNAIRDIVAAMTIDCTLAVHTGVESTVDS